MGRVTLAVSLFLVATACGKPDAKPAAEPSPVSGTLTTVTTPRDSDVAVRGNGVPKGYAAQFDSPNATPADASYREEGSGRWEVRTGLAHILYSPDAVTQKGYTVTGTFEQLEAPAHPEAYGVFVGGSLLENAAKRRYTYVIVRGDGQYAIKVRDGAATRTVKDWTAHEAIPKQDASGKAVYGITVDYDGKTAHVNVNGKPVTTFTAKDGPVEGIAGVRVNHNLHLMVTPVSVIRR